MAITKSAKRAIRVSEAKRVYNDRVRKSMKEAVKVVRKSITTKADNVAKDLAEAFKQLDKAAKRGTIKKGQADRKKSRLALALNKALKK